MNPDLLLAFSVLLILLALFLKFQHEDYFHPQVSLKMSFRENSSHVFILMKKHKWIILIPLLLILISFVSQTFQQYRYSRFFENPKKETIDLISVLVMAGKSTAKNLINVFWGYINYYTSSLIFLVVTGFLSVFILIKKEKAPHLLYKIVIFLVIYIVTAVATLSNTIFPASIRIMLSTIGTMFIVTAIFTYIQLLVLSRIIQYVSGTEYGGNTFSVILKRKYNTVFLINIGFYLLFSMSFSSVYFILFPGRDISGLLMGWENLKETYSFAVFQIIITMTTALFLPLYVSMEKSWKESLHKLLELVKSNSALLLKMILLSVLLIVIPDFIKAFINSYVFIGLTGNSVLTFFLNLLSMILTSFSFLMINLTVLQLSVPYMTEEVLTEQ